MIRTTLPRFALFAVLALLACMTVPAPATAASNSPNSIAANMETATRLQRAGKHRRALVFARRALKQAERKYGRDSLEYAKVLEKLAVFYRKLGRPRYAAKLLGRARFIRRSLKSGKPLRSVKKKARPKILQQKKHGRIVKKSKPPVRKQMKAPAASRGVSAKYAKERPPAAAISKMEAPAAPKMAPLPAPVAAPKVEAPPTAVPEVPDMEPSIRSVPTSVPRKHKSTEAYTVVDIFYATDRNEIDHEEWEVAFGTDRGELSYGMCQVSIPKDHKPGSLESPSFWKLEFSETPEKHVVLLDVKPLDGDIYFNELRARVGKSEGKNAFIFVHGFNVTFENAARRTAQMSFDLGFDGAPVFYSWPSKGSLTQYVADQTTIQWAQKNLLTFLKAFVEKSDAENIYLVAHSMGNRALTGAVAELVTEQPELKKRFREIILAAPDIDAGLFKRDIAPKMIEASNNVTLYVSADDNALIASRAVHSYPRAGEAGDDIIVIDGIDTIDATGVDASMLAHSYVVEVKSIIADLLSLIRHGKRASERPKLRKIESNKGIYWAISGP